MQLTRMLTGAQSRQAVWHSQLVFVSKETKWRIVIVVVVVVVVDGDDVPFAIVDNAVHRPLNPLRIRLPLVTLTLLPFRTLLCTLDAELIRNRNTQHDSGKLPIHIY